MRKYWIILFCVMVSCCLIYVVYKRPRQLQKFYLMYKTKPVIHYSQYVKSYLSYRLFAPKNKNSSRLPLILYLHGGGQRGQDNTKQLDYLFSKFSSTSNQKKYPSYIIAPQCPERCQWVNRTNPTIPYTHYLQDETSESDQVKMIIEVIQKFINENPVDTNRIYIAGFSMGATGCWDILTRYPDLFAGAAIFSGVSDTTKAHLLSNISIWAFSGEHDSIAPARLNENMSKMVNKYHGNCKFIEIRNVEHYCVPKAFEETEIMDWLYLTVKTTNK